MLNETRNNITKVDQNLLNHAKKKISRVETTLVLSPLRVKDLLKSA